MPIFQIAAWIIGMITLPSILISSRTSMKGGEAELTTWWQFPLIALVIILVLWITMFVLPMITLNYAAGFRIGACIAVIYSFWMPENKGLYILASLFVLPFTLFVPAADY